MSRTIGSLLIDQTDSTLMQLFRYTLVGGLAFVIDYGALFLLAEFTGLHYLWAAALAFTLGLVTNYCISVRWVFGKRGVQNRQVEFLVFALLGVLGLGINEVVMLTLTSGAGLHYLLSKLVSTGVTYGWNFASRKVLLFSATPEGQEGNEPPLSWASVPENADA
jgi:putative flippase GtrA